VDPRTEGSGNVGALNTLRILSKHKGWHVAIPAALFVLLVDASKAIVSYLLALGYAPSVAILAPMVAIFGHNYPVWLKFKGGRGVAAFYGFLLYLNPLYLLPFLAIQGTMTAVTRRFSPGMILSLLLAFPSLHVAGISVLPSAVLAEFPVWLRYKEKHDKLLRGELGVGM